MVKARKKFKKRVRAWCGFSNRLEVQGVFLSSFVCSGPQQHSRSHRESPARRCLLESKQTEPKHSSIFPHHHTPPRRHHVPSLLSVHAYIPPPQPVVAPVQRRPQRARTSASAAACDVSDKRQGCKLAGSCVGTHMVLQAACSSSHSMSLMYD